MADFINARVIQKIATVSEWSTSTILPYKGEIMLVSDSTGKVVNIKVGDGINHFNDLPYMFENMSNFAVSDATDVSVAGRTNGQVLSWNSDINKWVARNEQSLAGYATQAWVMSVGFLAEDDADLLYKPINWFPEWAEITNKPTTLAGFGITDVYTKSQSDARYLDTLQSVTNRGNSTSLDISVRGVQLTDFLGLPTTPPDPSDVLSGRSYIWLGDGAEAGVPSSGTLAGLEDVSLSSLTNGQSLVWNASTLKWENATISSGGGTWGSITGVLSNQTDLQTALNGKANLVHTHAAGDIVSGVLNIARIPTGTTANTVALGNDSRINNGQTAYEWGDHAGKYLPYNGSYSSQSMNDIPKGSYFAGLSTTLTDAPFGIVVGGILSLNHNGGQLVFSRSGQRLAYRDYTNLVSSYSPWVELWTSGNLRSNAQNDARYMQVTAPANAITTGDINNWNTAFGWGNHAGLYASRASVGGSANSVLASDTRNTNPLPSTDLQRGVWFDFKLMSAIGTHSSSSLYGGSITVVPYSDDSGNNNAAFRLTQSSNGSSSVPELFVQKYRSGAWRGQYRLWHSGNLRSNAENDARYMQVTQPANNITAGDISNWNTAYAQRHTHTNKAFLDTINQNLSTSSSVTFGRVKATSALSIPTSAPTSPVSGEAYIWVEMD